ncbi:MAG: 16S rRNA (cytosine(1402)-N(4))-methyltransferase RsmH [Synergistaceae bacterium]|jgi:16S rRNA (cytosine1402-N4)-methyltransferase|nr:16S rRNA (cytosine(1402)-N(4))-methyltransferase RsmH [Synergistaceae bacterium]
MSPDTHIPVMLNEVMEIFAERISSDSQPLFLDATLGAAGHASALLEKFPQGRLIGFDQDGQARNTAYEALSAYGGRARIIGDNFRNMRQLCSEPGWTGADGVLFDLGVSNMQLTTPERGFSYQDEGPLDMRMDSVGGGESAANLVARLDVRELTRIFRDYGEERHAFQIAKAIVRNRERGGILATTTDLTALIRTALPAPVQRKMGTHPARRVFQALRIFVNSELDVLIEGLEGASIVTRNSGTVIVISYHSLEDRIVKRTFLRWVKEEKGKILTRHPIVPDEDEIQRNRKSRSAKLRAFGFF